MEKGLQRDNASLHMVFAEIQGQQRFCSQIVCRDYER